ncbi:MAG: hypothetical protein ACRDQ4_25825 [Pseudonocardiaceae bacterium]
MTRYAPVPLPNINLRTLRAGDFIKNIQEWLRSPPLRDLVEIFGGAIPSGPLTDVLCKLDVWSAGVWDFRSGRERHEARAKQFSRDVERAVRIAAHALGMTESSYPTEGSYDHMLVLGGMVETCLLRTAFAAAIARRYAAVADVAALAGLRPLSPRELEFCRSTRLVGCATEFDGMEAGVRKAFGLRSEPIREIGGAPEVDPRNSWRRHTYLGSTPPVQVLAAPSTEPARRRANTADTYAFWVSNGAPLTSESTILLVTSSLHVPFQHLDALRVLSLRHGCGIETVGAANIAAEGAKPSVTTILQEIRSAILSAMRLCRALDEGKSAQ